MRGVLGSGEPLLGIRQDGKLRTQGAEVACVSCHRRSGLGTREGRTTIPPIASRYLFQPRRAQLDEPDLPYVEGARTDREPYTDATLARAIREGVNSEGRQLGDLMPRFVLGDLDMAALISYLKQVDARPVPGVSDSLLHFATIVTADSDPVKRRGMMDVLEHYFADKNTFPFPPSPRMRSSGKTIYVKSMYMANRRWQLHVWNLTGPPATWSGQLLQFAARDPVVAVVSGLGGRNWAPVHEFCEQQVLPCLFPNVEVPVIADHDFYSLYLSKGVLLEEELIAKRISEPGSGPPIGVVQQIYRAGDSGEPAGAQLAAALKSRGLVVKNHVLAAGSDGRGVAQTLRGIAPTDSIVLWLRPNDIAALGEAPELTGDVFMSGLMGGLERAPLPMSWRARTRVAYPFDLPDQSRVRVNYALEWFKIRSIPVVAQQVQVDTYLACGLLAETVSHMADSFGREYLIERMTDMLEHKAMTGYYPRLGLADGQRFASKGGYLVRFAGPEGSLLQADGGWIVP